MYDWTVPRAWMTTEQAAERLGVKVETLYAYASRGLLHSERVPGDRRTRYRRLDVERLASRTGKAGRAGALEIVVETELTLLDPAGALYYRGWNVADAARTAGFEEVANWLWTGSRATHPFVAPPEALAAVASIVTALRDASPLDRVRAAVLAMRRADALRDDRRPESVAAAGRSTIAGTLAALQLLGDDPKDDQPSVAARLWPRVTSRPSTTPHLAQLETALVLLADHELARVDAARPASPRRPGPTPTSWSPPDWLRSVVRSTVGRPRNAARCCARCAMADSRLPRRLAPDSAPVS